MLSLEGLVKRFPNGTLALDGVDLTVGEGEIVGIVGTSGCGKSTLLRLLAGLDHPTGGRVTVDGAPVSEPSPSVGMIFQEPRLMPWLTVTQNVTFGIAGLPKAEQARRAREALARVGLSDFAEAHPRQLSGGMAQRVAIARALVRRPSILLLDEPFSALDSFTRLTLQDHLLKIWEGGALTMVFVTHDLEEALALSDRVVVMRSRPGRIHNVFQLSDPRPRRRDSQRFQSLKTELMGALDLYEDAAGI